LLAATPPCSRCGAAGPAHYETHAHEIGACAHAEKYRCQTNAVSGRILYGIDPPSYVGRCEAYAIVKIRRVCEICPTERAVEIRYYLQCHQSRKESRIPRCGSGTRFLPVTKASRRKCSRGRRHALIQYALDEALRRRPPTTLISSPAVQKRAIEDHFDSNPEIESVAAGARQQNCRHSARYSRAGMNCSVPSPAPTIGLGNARAWRKARGRRTPLMVHPGTI